MGFSFNTVPSIISAPGAVARLGESALARLGACAALRALDLSGNAVADHGDALRAALPQVEHWDNK